MDLHLPTLLIGNLIACFVLAAAVLFVGLGRTERDGVRWWGAGLALHGLSYVTFYARYLDWELTSIVLTNLLLAAAPAAHLLGLAQFHGRRLSRAVYWIPVAAALAVAVVLSDQHVARNAVNAMIFCSQAAMLTWMAWRTDPDYPRERGRILLSVSLLGLVALYAVRIVMIASGTPHAGVTATVTDQMQSVSYMIGMQILVVSTVGYVLMHKERAEAVLRHDATHDALTGLANRRGLMAELEREWALAIRTGQPLAVLMIDIDYFKRINDTHGHPVGDRVLKKVARRIRARLRVHDIVGRYGGEEFLVLMPSTDAEGAMTAAEAVRREFHTPVHAGTLSLPVTVSVGAHARQPRRGDDHPDRMISAADRAMYRAKQAGRNRCELET